MSRYEFVVDGRRRTAPDGFVNYPSVTPPLPYADALAAAAELNRQRPDDLYWVRDKPVHSPAR